MHLSISNMQHTDMRQLTKINGGGQLQYPSLHRDVDCRLRLKVVKDLVQREE